MAHGGKRIGAGRPVGRPSHAARAAEQMASATGVTPLQYMLEVMRDAGVASDRRDDMAKAAAPYIHPRLASTESKVTVSKDSATDWTREELERFLNDAQARGDGAAAPREIAGEPDKLH